nr:hypothetical protein [Bacteroidota bacterium]
MRLKNITTLLMLIFSFGILFAQDKAPIAENDYYDLIALDFDTLFVLDNDFADEGHPVKIVNLMQPNFGYAEYSDTTILIYPAMNYKGLDSLRYRILDQVNGLYSELATVYLQISNKGFDT